ncbi:MAG: DUF4175 family protein [Candidatus Cloacimonadota bacterium]|nr:DUF4175 family protein [Candidatus Cloacimonadota bacterium]
MRSIISKKKAAEYLDKYNQDEFDTFQNALELCKQEQIDVGIREKLVEKANARAEKQKIKTNSKSLKQLLFPSVIIILVTLISFSIFPKGFIRAWDFFHMRSIPEKEHKKFVEVEPGNVQITRNSEVIIQVIRPEMEVEHELFYRYHEQWRKQRLTDFSYRIRNIDRTFDYFVRTPYAVSDTFRIEVFELPVVKESKIKYEYPKYTNQPDRFEENSNGHISALENTKVSLEITSNNPLQSAEMIFSYGELSEMQRLGKKRFRAEFNLEKSGSYHINLIDILGNKNNAIEREIKKEKDLIPEIEITQPAQDTILNQNMLLPLKILVSDDFGLQNLELIYQVNSSPEDTLMIQHRIDSKDLAVDYLFDLNNEYLVPGDRITYWVSVWDNKPNSQQAISNSYIATFPSIEQIYKEIETEELEKQEKMSEILQESDKLNRKMENKRLELMKKEEYNWQDKKELEEILMDQEKLNQDIQKVAQDYKNLTEKFEQNQALSQETIDKMKRIQEIMEEIANEELKEAMGKMQKTMQDMNPESIKKAMEDFKFSMEEFNEKLEQTLKLLENIKKEQAMQKALEISEEMAEMQKDLNEKNKNKQLSSQKQAELQRDIKEKLQNLEEQLENTDSLLASNDEEIKKMLEELQQQIQEDSLSQQLEQIIQELENNGNPSEQMQQVQQQMENYSQKIGEMKNSMSAGMMSANTEAIQDAITNLIFISLLHESSAEKYTDDPYQILSSQIANYESINRILQELYQTPMILLVLGPKFIHDTNFTMTSYHEMFSYINDANKSKIPTFLEDIQKGINIMVYDLMMARDNMSSSGGGSGGMQQLMQAMKEMGEQQMVMNSLTQQLLEQMSREGSLTREARDEMQRLARDEKRLAENLKRILQTNEEAQKQTNALDRIIEDLEEVSRKLRYNRIDSSLIEKQERILSRLLDAQKSIHKREYSKQRQGKQSEVENWEFPEDLQQQFDKLKQKALLEENYKNYPELYQKIIREYLKKLNEA